MHASSESIATAFEVYTCSLIITVSLRLLESLLWLSYAVLAEEQLASK